MLLPTRLFNVTGAFLYPAYASYKALSQRPAQPVELERWLMYWALIGAWTTAEGVIGWFLEWIPFYTICKTLVFLYLAQPGNRLGPYLYCNGLAPLFAENEGEIDAFLGSLSGRATNGARGGLWWIWDQARRALGLSQEQASQLSNAAGLPQPPAYPGIGAGRPGAGFQSGAGAGVGGAPGAPGAPGTPAYAQQAFGLVSNLATRYMPSALGAVYAAGNSFNNAGNPGSAPGSRSVSSSSTSPFPVTPGTSSLSSSTATARGFDLPPMPSVPSGAIGVSSSSSSRTFSYATDESGLTVTSRTEARMRTSSRTSSDGSLSGGSNSLAASGFAEIHPSEADGAEGLVPHARHSSSSWMRWSKEKEKEQ
ncbi:uncharacterized protein EHS24_000392 [Apiotrichum porosum]|uniref:Protein YOP1 n=1 Tax=Apiotrichum porosum TaxID=105984 RepID=A0A427YA58_9TREE|nr:uncharacterized protein EHS24_000392 [Apiotrichum porosum]RSH87874.1 hypothetical protein EHS24_000392 [Apiotrichum porosum]